MLSIAYGCARSRTLEGEGGRDAAIVGSDGSTIDPSRDGGRETRDGAPIDPDPTRDGGRARDGGRDAGTPPSPEALELARLECLNEAACDPNALGVVFFEGLDGCIAALAEVLEPVLARGHAAPTSQWCLTTRAADADCDGFRDDDDGRSVLDCVEPAGRLRSGEPCIDDLECGRSATGGEMHCFECRCRPLLREGDRCHVGTCATDLRCTLVDSELVCARPGDLPAGAVCSDEDPSTWCATGNRCLDGVCVRQPRHGEVCVLGSGVSCFDPRSPIGTCESDDDGVHRCRPREPLRPAVSPGARCTRSDTCAGGAACPDEGVCPSDCTDGERLCAIGACNEATGDCGIPQECVGG